MGQYNTAVLTTAGQALLTSILGAQGTLTFSKFQTSSYQYASGTDLSSLTSLQSVEQEVTPSAGGIKDATTFYSSSTVDNTGVTVEYVNYTVGLFATDGDDEVLFAVSTAITPDVIPVDDGGTPSTYTYTMSIGVSSTANITVEVDDQGILRVQSIVNNLTSTSTTAPLSAAQGKALKDLIDQGGGGHVILDPSGTEMTQRDKLQFKGTTVTVTDDPDEEATVVDFGLATGSIVLSQGGSVVSSVSLDNSVGRSINLDSLFNTNAPTYSIVSSDSTVADATLNAAKTVLTVTALKAGNVTITISTPATNEYTAASVTLSVSSTVFIPVDDGTTTYVLGSGAHTGGSALAEAVCLSVDTVNMKAVMASKGLYGAAWPGSGELSLSTHMGNLNTAIDDAYLPRNQNGDTTNASQPTGVSFYNGSTWDNSKSSTLLDFLKLASQSEVGASDLRLWLGTEASSSNAWRVMDTGITTSYAKTTAYIIAPTFILDLTKVKLHGSLICLLTEPDMPEIVAWSSNDDEKIAAMVAADAAGYLNLYDWWQDNDEKSVTLSAMEATGVGESHVQQEVTFVLSKDSCKQLSSALTSGRTYSKYLIHQKNCLLEKGYMNSTNTNTGSWKNCARRTWCNDVFYNAIPATLRAIFKQFKNLTAQTPSGSTNENVDDYFAYPAEKEVFDARVGSNATEFNALTQFNYYKTSVNRIKTLGDGGTAVSWFERSPDINLAGYFCLVYNGNASDAGAASNVGISPFGVI